MKRFRAIGNVNHFKLNEGIKKKGLEIELTLKR